MSQKTVNFRLGRKDIFCFCLFTKKKINFEWKYSEGWLGLFCVIDKINVLCWLWPRNPANPLQCHFQTIPITGFSLPRLRSQRWAGTHSNPTAPRPTAAPRGWGRCFGHCQNTNILSPFFPFSGSYLKHKCEGKRDSNCTFICLLCKFSS